MGEEPAELDGLKVEARRTLHTPNSLCYRLTDRAGGSLFYSGDMDFQEALLPFARGAGLKRLLLTHFYQPVSRRKVRAQVRRAFRGPLCLARDLLTLSWRG